VGSSSFLVCGGRGSIAAVSDEVLQWECIQLQSLWELQRNLWKTTEKFMGAEFLEQKQYSMYRQLRDASKRAEPVGPIQMSPYVFGVYTVLIL
jgi:hypothetical protein